MFFSYVKKPQYQQSRIGSIHIDHTVQEQEADYQ